MFEVVLLYKNTKHNNKNKHNTHINKQTHNTKQHTKRTITFNKTNR